MSEYGFSEKRNKGKNKKRENKKYPYKKGGKHRTDGVVISSLKQK